MLLSFRTPLLLTCLLLAMGGCSSVKDAKWVPLPTGKDEKKSEKPAKKPDGIPKLDVAGPNLGEGQEVSLAIEPFVQSVQTLLEERRFVSASRWIARHPETALELVRRAGENPAPPDTLLFIARVHDSHTMRVGNAVSWERLISSQLAQPNKYKEYREGRKQFLAALGQGHVAAAGNVRLMEIARALNEPLLEIDAMQLAGTAHVLAEQPAEAAAAWEQALALADQHSPYQATQIALLLCDARRRSRNGAAAIETWLDTAARAAGLLDPRQPCIDPVLWERVAYQRPVQATWPDAVVAKFREIDPLPDQAATVPSSSEVYLWNCIGRWYLDRGQHQAALVAFKRAESATGNGIAQQHLRFRQARALVLLDQAGPATAILMSLARDDSSPVQRPAAALLGSMRLQAGQAQQGLNLLRRALEEDDVRWPERASAEADFGLACLMNGDERQGLERVHRARQTFETTGDFEALVLSLQNETRYLDNAKRPREAEALRRQLQDLENSLTDN